MKPSVDAMRTPDDDAPSPAFVAQLRTTLRREAQRLEAESARPTAARRGPRARASHAAAVAVLLAVIIVAAQSFGGPGAPRLPAAIPASTGATPSSALSAFADVPTSGGNWARTNVQPGPGLTSAPEVLKRSDVAGTGMALADGVLVITTQTKATALDAATLRELWTVDMPGGAYSPPTIAEGQIFIGVDRNTEQLSGKASDNQLLAFSLRDGHELWRVDGAGTYPVSPIVDGGTVYSLGVVDGHYQLGAYRISDGGAIWSKQVGPFNWCCPPIGIALSGGALVVSTRLGLAAVDAASGAPRWDRVPENGQSFGAPMIADGLVVVNAAPDSAGATVTAGSTTAYDLQTGDVRWSNVSTRLSSAPISATSTGILYAGPWEGGDTGRLSLMATATGRPIWTVPLPHASDDDHTYLTVESAPAIVAGVAYVALGTNPDGVSTDMISLIAAIDLATGQTIWLAKIDGNVAAPPIVSGGELFALTPDAGLIALVETGQAPSPVGTPVDLLRKVTCAEPPSQSPMLGSLPATPSIPGLAPWKQPILFSQVPTNGAPVSTAVAEQLQQRFEAYRACSASDPYNRVYGFFSTDFYTRLQALNENDYNSKAQPWAIWMAPMSEYLALDVKSLKRLPDGRTGGLINSPYQNIYVWWVLDDGVWKIDEYHRIEADVASPVPVTPPAAATPFG